MSLGVEYILLYNNRYKSKAASIKLAKDISIVINIIHNTDSDETATFHANRQ